eukprot:Seg628.2 transcript_id=Seg628.2/GoldUCD/mRNA.D3Y31 product="Potassium voltage-gated channel subfamily A member 10" protein_id=Seg628.2/GoldUCD/D3Y31
MESFRLDEKRKTVLLVLEGICVAWFTFELAIRFIVCPSRIKFIKNIMNWIDFLAIIPFFVEIILVYAFKETSDIMYLQIIRVIRVFRIIKLSKHNVGLQILGHTLKASIRELFLLIFFLAIGIVIFASIVYYCEKDQKGTKFQSIPNTFWWAVITMTTVGYGDMAPTTPAGKLQKAKWQFNGSNYSKVNNRRLVNRQGKIGRVWVDFEKRIGIMKVVITS